MIGCDESGAEGEKLIGGNTDVFAHASVAMSPEAAAACMAEIRVRAPSPTTEFKSSILRRDKHRRTLMWLLSQDGPLHGQALVHLADKAFVLVSRLVAMLPDPAPGQAAALYREGPLLFGQERWTAFLASANDHLRSRNGPVPLVDLGPGPVDEIVVRLAQHAEPRPSLDPLFPAVARAIAYWGKDGRPVTVIHDRQTSLAHTGVTLMDSRLDARIQVADLLAGAAMRIASSTLRGEGDPELTALLSPFVDPESIWADWSLLGG